MCCIICMCKYIKILRCCAQVLLTPRPMMNNVNVQ